MRTGMTMPRIAKQSTQQQTDNETKQIGNNTMNKETNIGQFVENGTLVAGTGACAAGMTAAAIGGAPGGLVVCGFPFVAELGSPFFLTTIATAPAWALPVAIAGGAAALGAVGWKVYKRIVK